MEEATSSDVLSTLLTIGYILLIIVASTGALAFWLFMIYDEFKNASLSTNKKSFWIAGTIVIPPVAIIYYFTAHTRHIQQIY